MNVRTDPAIERISMSLNLNPTIDLDGVKAVVIETLGVEDRADSIVATTPLLGSLPELDSMAVLELVLALEERFDISLEDEDVSADIFETLASLAAFVAGKRR
jgi:acyl carrier protein